MSFLTLSIITSLRLAMLILGYAKLADFGMADKLSPSGVSFSHGGTLVYMSPESRDSNSDRAQRKTHDFFAGRCKASD